MIIFAKTRYNYDSYSDFWKLVELSGFDTCFVDEIDIAAQNTTYIITPINGEFRPHIKHHRDELKKPWNAKLIWWNLERHTTMDNVILDDIVDYVNDIWVSDRYYATLNKKFKFVVLGSHPDLRMNKDNISKIYDYCHISYVYGRRDYIHYELKRHGLNIGPNGWGEERDKILRASKLLINIHQDIHPISEPLRFAICAAYSLPIISETIKDPYPLIQNKDIIITDYDGVITKTIEKYNSDLSYMSNAIYDNLCIKNTFKISVEKGLI